MATASLPQDLAAQIKYGAQTGSAVRRSQYLADALKQIGTTGSTNIQSGGELAAKLLATAILNKAGKSADKQALQSIADQQGQETDSILAGFARPPAAAPAPALPQMPPQAAQPPPMPAPQPQTPPQVAPAALQASPEDRDALTRMLAVEALGEGPEGMAAAGHVAMNRLKNGYGGAKTLKDVIFQPHQFEGMNRANQVTPDAYAKAGQVADAILSGQMADPTNGAMAFLNPEMQVKGWGGRPGMPIPKWASGGDGHRIGNHVFFGGKPQQMAQQQAAPPQAQGPDLAAFAAGGAGADPFPAAPPQPIPPSASSASPGPAAGTAPAGNVPQAEPAGATPHGITSEQIGFLEKLLKNPRTHEAGMAYAMELQKKAAEPTKFDTTNINGLPTQIDPYTGQVRPVDVPANARTRVVSAAEAGIPAPPGTMVSIDPLGNVKEVSRPQQGQQALTGPGQPYREAPIQGGTNDPRAPAATFNNEGKLRDDYAKEVQPFVLAREGYQKVVQAAGDMSQAGAIALVFGYMKTLDPGSTVREGEQATVQNSGSIPQTVANMYNKLVAGQSSLTPEQREQFATSAQGQFNVYKRTFDAANERYGELAKNYGYNPNNVIRHFDDIQPFVAPTAGAGASRAPIPQAAQDAYRARFQRGLIDPKAPVGTQNNPLQARDAATLQALDTPANKGKYVIGPDGQFGVID